MVNPKTGIMELENLENYFILPGNGSRPDLLVSVNRHFYNETWDRAHRVVNGVGGFMLPLPYAVEFFRLLISDVSLFYGNGKNVGQGHRDIVISDIFDFRNPYRAEWFDSKFSVKGNVFYVSYHKVGSGGSRTKVTEPIEGCLVDNKIPGIDLGYWLNNATSQGLPTKNTPGGSLYYWRPRDDSVARFGADSDGVGLGCSGNPRGSDAGLGVRVAKTR